MRKHRKKIDHNTEYLYYRYKSKYQNTNLFEADSQAKYTKVLNLFHEKILHKIFTDNYVFTSPFGFGKLYLVKIKPRIVEDGGKLRKTTPVNIKATKELWAVDEEAKENRTLVRYNNFHTDGYYYQLFWSKKYTKFNNARYYNLSVHRKYNRQLAQLIFNGEADTPYASEYKSNLAF